jgi:SAM-dependent methyltransferase
MASTRNEKILANCSSRKFKCLEIGPLHNPVLQKSEYDVEYVDFATTEYLRKKYHADPNVDINLIVEVDYVLGQKTLSESLAGSKFDFVVASHVLEHVPDLIGWLFEIDKVLNKGGVLSLALPDRHYTFDNLRTPTSIEITLANHSRKLTRPDAFQIIDFILNFNPIDATTAWNLRHENKMIPVKAVHSVKDALRMAHDSEVNQNYHDVHCSVFNPIEFISLMTKLAEYELLSFLPINFFRTVENEFEFFISLKKASDKRKILRSWLSLLASLEDI